jgi:type IV pilus assembly protein PilA
MQDIITRLRAKKGDEGFTLIELLVVVVIIGVLVAIAVPVYLNYRKGAADKSAQSDVRGAISAIEQFYTDNGNTYPDSITGTNPTVLSLTLTAAAITGTTNQVITISDKTQLSYVKVGTTSYLVCGTNAGGSTVGVGTKWYSYNSLNGGSVKAATTVLVPATCA